MYNEGYTGASTRSGKRMTVKDRKKESKLEQEKDAGENRTAPVGFWCGRRTPAPNFPLTLLFSVTRNAGEPSRFGVPERLASGGSWRGLWSGLSGSSGSGLGQTIRSKLWKASSVFFTVLFLVCRPMKGKIRAGYQIM